MHHNHRARLELELELDQHEPTRKCSGLGLFLFPLFLLYYAQNLYAILGVFSTWSGKTKIKLIQILFDMKQL